MLVCLIFKDLLLERAVGMSEVCVELVGKLVGEMLGLSKEELSLRIILSVGARIS